MTLPTALWTYRGLYSGGVSTGVVGQAGLEVTLVGGQISRGVGEYGQEGKSLSQIGFRLASYRTNRGLFKISLRIRILKGPKMSHLEPI